MPLLVRPPESVPSHGAVDVNLDRKEIIAGHPIKKVRDFLKTHFKDEVDASHAQQLGAEYFGSDSDTILAELNKRGWLEEGKRTWKPPLGQTVVHATYNRTKLGQQVAIAKLIARFSRVKGEAILTALVERAYQINANPELCSYIKQLRLFGSMLDSSIPMVGDVDVAVELGRRKPPLNQNGVSRDWVEWNIERFEASGRTGGSFLDRICYGDIEVMRRLKSRVAGLSLHPLEDLNSIGAPSAPLFEITPLEIARFEVPTISQGRE
jgi:hypothetical protein